MDPQLLLHTSARRYLLERYGRLTGEYSAPPGQGRADDGGYTPAALRLFPRYQVADTILAEVDRWITGNPPATVEPLPYRRVLRQAESDDRLHLVAQRWAVAGKSWHPMITGATPPDVLVLRADAFWDGPGTAQVRQALGKTGDRRVTELTTTWHDIDEWRWTGW